MIGPAATTAAEAILARFQEDEDEEFCRSAIQSLAKMGEAVIPHLLRATSHPNWRVRGYAINALGKLGIRASSALKMLTPLLQDSDEDVVKEVKKAIKRIKGENG
jgi:HEAT repeat protein